MGKKSKKKGGGGNNTKAARKERLQERREQQLQDLDQNEERLQEQREQQLQDDLDQNEQNSSDYERPFFEGDRVWFCKKSIWGDGDNPNNYRGIVKEVHEDSLDIIPLQSKIDGNDVSVRTKLDSDEIFPDFCNLTLRFDVGDEVLCSAEGWVPRTVTYLWPIAEISMQDRPTPKRPGDMVPHYKCGNFAAPDQAEESLAAPDDDDYCIREHSSSFRFGVGANIAFNASKSVNSSKIKITSSHWLEATIASVDITGLKYYAAYKCVFDIGGKQYLCHIVKDDDEHIARRGANPRDRLFEAISQDCSRQHFVYLTTAYNIDVTTFRDLVIAKALDHASYQALAWLQHDCGIDVLHSKDDSGNNLLHKIASSFNAIRFIKEAARISFMDHSPDWKLELATIRHEALTNAQNKNGDTWLQLLVRRGDAKALDVALSPISGLAWDLAKHFYFNKDNLASLAGSVGESGDAIVQCIFDSFVSFRELHEQYQIINILTGKSEDELFEDESMRVFKGEDDTHHAKLLARFFLDWRDYRGQMWGNPFISLVKKGYFKFFGLMYNANESLFLNERCRLQSKEDRNEYIQPELNAKPDDSSYESLNVDIFMACIIGDDGPSGIRDVADAYERDYYLRTVRQHISCDPDDCPSLLSHLKGLEHYYKNSPSYGDKKQKYWETKVHMLEDDKNLEGRLKILDYLLQRQPSTKLDVLETLRHRQCGVLRFMVEKGLVELEADASRNKLFTKAASKLKFLENGRIPTSISTKCFLCFAAVEYDDFQSLEWLCKSSGVPVETCHGWNLLHFGTFMGRVEIVAWFCTQTSWQALVSEVSHRTPFHNAFAVHIAASEGHIFLADMLLSLKVEAADKKGKMPEQYAKKSQHKFVQKWAAEKEKPRGLEKSIKKLLQLLNSKDTTSEKLMNFIVSSKCFEIETWRDCEFYSFDMEGPLGHSLGDLLNECCSKRPDIALWLCTRLYFCNDYSSNVFWGDDTGVGDLTKRLALDDLVKFSQEQGYDDILQWLPKRCFKDISCADPARETKLLKTALNEGKLLLDVRAKLLRVILLLELVNISDKTAKDLLQGGGRPDELDEILKINTKVKDTLISEGYAESGYKYWVVRPTDMTSCHLSGDGYRDEHPLSKQLLFRQRSRYDLSKVHIVLATEGYTDLLFYCLKNFQGWTVEMELDVVRIASFFGHSAILDIFLRSDGVTLLSDANDRAQAAMLGSGESCRLRDLVSSVELFGTPYDPVKEERLHSQKGEDWEKRNENQQSFMSESLICAVINGYAKELFDDNNDNKKELNTLQFLVDRLSYTHNDVLYAMELFMSRGYTMQLLEKNVELLHSMIDALNIDPVLHHDQMRTICKEIVTACVGISMMYKSLSDDDKNAQSRVVAFLGRMADLGIDIQNLISEGFPIPISNPFEDQFHELEKRQLYNWSQFDTAKKGGSLEEIQDVIDQGALTIKSRYRGGLLLTHLSASYDRVDLLEWLVVTKGMNIYAKDGQGRTALDVAKAAKAASTTKWITEWKAKRTIVAFLQRNYRRLVAIRKQQRLLSACITIQKCYRGCLVRKLYSGALLRRLEESQRFSAIWGALVQSAPDLARGASTWSSIREQVSDINHAELPCDDSYFDDMDEQLSRALEGALQVHDGSDDDHEMGIGDNEDLVLPSDIEPSAVTVGENDDNEASWLSFQMTSHVVKFLKQGDPKYKGFFVRRMQQLANGERSRILQKRLKGSESTIFETYLEQKSGFRILWTEEGNNIVIWFVAKHKEVSRLMKLIDDSKSRSARQQLPASLVSELQNDYLLPQLASRKEVLLDVFGNTPMKIYDVNLTSIDEITRKEWTPKLHLTDEEREIVEGDGTVLVLGRSGTGKTVCICNRMEYDRQRCGQDPTFSQLFVARSKRLCRYVSETVGTHDQSAFETFDELVHDIEASLPRLEDSAKSFLPSQRMDFRRFKQDFFGSRHSSKEKRVGALIVWTVIRTFIKGSIEAFKSPDGILPKADFVAVEKLGKNRCRVPAELREYIYDELFLRYEKYKNELGLWDDSDRIRHLLLRLDKSKQMDPDAFDKVRRSRIYVDEIQDYTQVECLLFFYLGGPGGLFLAGDPAQSVVEGTEFRFDEIRSVGYFIASERNERSDLIPQKPKIVNVNFRSHSGILNLAGAFLDFLFEYFPGSAKQLKKDFGLFHGSRPGVLHKINIKQLSILLSEKLKGTVVLCHDDSVHHWRRALGDYKLVYGIREAKGLEFKSVIILNFFQELPSSLQKPWRNLVLNREGFLDFETKHPLVGSQLKLLYTGITRCIERLFFVETSSSIAGDTVVRWLTTSSVAKKAGAARQGWQNHANALATRNNIDDIEAMAMTSDEFVSEGFNNAEFAETGELDLEQAQNSLDRAIWCFEQAGSTELAAKARTHRLSIQLRLYLSSVEGDDQNENDRSMVEVKGAQMMESLTKEGMLFEVLNVFHSMRPFLTSYAKEKLEKLFISKIQTVSRG